MATQGQRQRRPGRYSANPTAAVVISVIVVLLGIWMVRVSGEEVANAFGWMMIVIGIIGALANLYIRTKWRP